MGIWCSIPVLVGLLGVCAPEPPRMAGYVEGEYVQVAPIEPARIEHVDVAAGAMVAAGRRLAVMERRASAIALREAEAALAAARAHLAELEAGSRAEEIRRLEAAREAAAARVALLEREVARAEKLFASGDMPEARLDDLRTRLELARAELAQAEASLALARDPVRRERLDAARAEVRRAEAVRDRAAWRLSQRVVIAPVAGRVETVLRRPGEIAGPGAPLLTLLPEGRVKVIFHVPGRFLPRLHPGLRLPASCAGCPEGISVEVARVLDGPEFTPPVIYSTERREKLVWRVEARPVAGEGSAHLQPGQIIDVFLPEEADAGDQR